jgi:hypothetical protein
MGETEETPQPEEPKEPEDVPPEEPKEDDESSEPAPSSAMEAYEVVCYYDHDTASEHSMFGVFYPGENVMIIHNQAEADALDACIEAGVLRKG